MTPPLVATDGFYISMVRSLLKRGSLSPAGNQEGGESEGFAFLPGCNREEIQVKMCPWK